MTESNDAEMVAKAVGGELLKPDAIDAALGDDTLGTSDNMLDALTVLRPGKGKWFEVGDEEKKEAYGIFLFSKRPIRACWEKDELTGDSPVCVSFDSIHPIELSPSPFAEACSDCPSNALGSGQGKTKKCKTKAADFFILLRITPQEAGQAELSGEPIDITPDRIIGPAMVQYSIGNRGASRAWQGWQRVFKEAGHRPQGIITRWSFGEDTTKGGTDYDFVKLDMVAPLPSPQDAPGLWEMIVQNVTNLRSGQAVEVLTALSGLMGGDDTDDDK